MRYLLVRWLFTKLFSGYEFPFEKLNVKIMKMNDIKRKNYYQQAREVLEAEVYQDILQESIRKFYQKLSASSNGKVEQTSYRLALSWISEEFDGTLRKLALSFNDNPTKINPKLK